MKLSTIHDVIKLAQARESLQAQIKGLDDAKVRVQIVIEGHAHFGPNGELCSYENGSMARAVKPAIFGELHDRLDENRQQLIDLGVSID